MERRDLIAGRLVQGRSVAANTLAEEFGLSEDAIRRDLRADAALGRDRTDAHGTSIDVELRYLRYGRRLDATANERLYHASNYEQQ